MHPKCFVKAIEDKPRDNEVLVAFDIDVRVIMSELINIERDI